AVGGAFPPRPNDHNTHINARGRGVSQYALVKLVSHFLCSAPRPFFSLFHPAQLKDTMRIPTSIYIFLAVLHLLLLTQVAMAVGPSPLLDWRQNRPLWWENNHFWSTLVPELPKTPSEDWEFFYAPYPTYKGIPIYDADRTGLWRIQQALNDHEKIYVFEPRKDDGTGKYAGHLVPVSVLNNRPWRRTIDDDTRTAVVKHIDSFMHFEKQHGRLARSLVYGTPLRRIPFRYRKPSWAQVATDAREFQIDKPETEFDDDLRHELQKKGMAKFKQKWSGYVYLVRATEQKGIEVKYFAGSIHALG
ncbi:hypothetical protein BCV70DRAFT_223630, partial [Testicularia cyperi]